MVMKEIQDYQQDIASIRSIMERSAKFISLTGLSGVLAGIFALAGAAYSYFLLYYPYSPFGFRFYYMDETVIVIKLLATAGGVLILSLVTGYIMSKRKATRLGVNVWNKSSRLLLINLAIPLVAGGLFILIMVSRGYYMIIASTSLLFYGLALINGSQFTYKEIRYLGFTEIILGLLSAWLPGYGLIFWALGFGVLHIVYGSVMYYRHDK
jgi:hypothetical protein